MTNDTAISAVAGASCSVFSAWLQFDINIFMLNVNLEDAIFKIGITAIAAILGGFLGALGKHFFYRWVLKKKPKKK